MGQILSNRKIATSAGFACFYLYKYGAVDLFVTTSILVS